MTTFRAHGIGQAEAVELVLECPELVSVNLAERLREAHFLFELYCGFAIQDTIRIFRAFPFMACVDHRKLTLFCGEFKKFRFSKEQIITLCDKSGGLLGASVSNFRGVFDTLRAYGITAKDTKILLDAIPELVMQNRKGLLRRKIITIEREGGLARSYTRNFIKRHPDFLMRSLASYEAKVNYLQRTLNR